MTVEHEAVIGLEVHVELLTNTKLFCSCSTGFGAEPNSQVCPVCLALPGATLPLLNRKAVEFSIKTALALNCQIAGEINFDRKNYFYADLPKGYQISQFFNPIGTNGYIEINHDHNRESRKIGIRQLHMEEDTGKLFHEGDILSSPFSRVDFNRAGVPLMEIVTEPDIRSAEEARLFLQKLRNILRYINVSDCKMEEGSLRCDANVSVKSIEGNNGTSKTELKNMNSFKAVFKGIEYEIERQRSIVKEGGKVTPETRHWDEGENVTRAMRSKLTSANYRCFPDPNLPPLKNDKRWIKEIRKSIPELPDERYNRFIKEYELPPYDAEILISSLEIANYFDITLKYYNQPKTVSNWIMSELLRLLNAENIDIKDCKIKPEDFGKLLNLIEQEVISGKIAKSVFEEMFNTGENPETIVEKKGLRQISDEDTLAQLVEETISNNPQSVEDYLNGKKKALGFLVGEIMKKTKGQANPQMVNQILREKIEK